MEPLALSDDRLARLRSRLRDRFEFVALLGQGGGGAVFEVHNRRLDRREGLKVLATSLEGLGAQRFEHEARILASLDHPRIVKIYEFGQDAGLPWYSMQYVDGPSLGGLLESGFRFELPMIAGLAMPILDALAYSHGMGVVHRDIKPANILVNRQGRPFLTDFGIAKSRESTHQTLTGQMLGTPAYVAPEQALGEEVDARADQYSLAITLYRILAGRLPFSSENVLQTVVQRLKEPPVPILVHRPDLPEGLAAVLMRALEADRTLRWPDIRALRGALQEAFEAAAIPWNEPLPGVADHPVVRRPLAPGPGAEAPGDTEPLRHRGFAMTTDLPSVLRQRKRKRLAVLAPVLLGLVGGSVWAWRSIRSPAGGGVESAPPTVAPRPAPSPLVAPPVEPVRRSGTAAPKTSPVEAQSAQPARRPLTYPELLPGQPTVQVPPGCAGQSAQVTLLVGEDGRVRSCRILKEVPEECRKAFQELAMKQVFRPALDDQGRPIAASSAISITLPEAP